MKNISRLLLLLLTCFAQYANIHAVVQGDGSTVLKNFLQQVCRNFNAVHPNPGFSYAGTSGSGQGLEDLIAGKIGFAGSDVPPTSEQIQAARASGCNLLTIPVAVTGTAFAYNLPGYNQPLRLTAQNIADILKGTIRFWDDAQLAVLNPALKARVGRLLIRPVVRTDSSGTTGNINLFLSSVLGSSAWPFSGTQAAMPIPPAFGNPNSVGRKGSNAVGQFVNNNPGAFGYIGFDVLQSGSFANARSAAIKNQSGEFLAPTISSIANALNGLSCVPTNLRTNTINSAARGAYAIASPTNIVVCLCKATKPLAKDFNQFLSYVINQGQNFAAQNFLAPVNNNQRVLQQSRVIIDRIRTCS